MHRSKHHQHADGAIAAGAVPRTKVSSAEVVSPSKRRPNLVLVFPDQMRAAAQGFRRDDPVHTPNLDRFACDSVVLDQAVSNYPVCSPFRAMLMTGQYPPSHGVLRNCNSKSAQSGYALKTDARCWSDVLKDHGYSLGYIGKWHLDAPHPPYVDSYNNQGELKWNEWCPPARRHGFDFWHAYGTYDRHLSPHYWTTTMARDERLNVDAWSPQHEADTAIDFICNTEGKHRDPTQPFALVVSMNPPHPPFDQVPDRYLEPYLGR